MPNRLTLLMILFAIGFLFSTASAEERLFKLPPESLAQWYKPHNERQVWLHTMFNLRREMQAIQQYVERGDQTHLKKWTASFSDHYRKIAEMVPEWSDELDLEQLTALNRAVDSADLAAVKPAMRRLQQSCRSCHGDYRALVAATYRAPDFTGLRIHTEQGEADYAKAMEMLSMQINRIKIASVDGLYTEAKESLVLLESGLSSLGESCQACHQEPEPKERYLGQRTRDAMTELAQGLDNQDPKQSGRALGSVAVYACARCHSVHRTLSDLRAFID